MYVEYIIFTASISVAYLNTSDDLVVFDRSSSRFASLQATCTHLNVHKYVTNHALAEEVILLFLLYCVYIWQCVVYLME